jgi:hypothetical protein
LGQRRAGAAITLLRQGERESILDVLRGDSGGGLREDPDGGLRGDPESLTQFVHRCRARGILPPQLLECLKLADQLRQPKTGEARRIEDRVLYGLLLALGEFELTELPEAQREGFVEQLTVWYAGDPSSAVHGATGWLLRRWKQDESATKVDQTAVPFVEGREWFTLEFVVPDQEGGPDKESGDESPHSKETKFYVTFVVFPAGEYPIGSPPNEADHLADENLHPVKLTRPMAVSDREITWAQLNPFLPGRHDNW